MSSTCQKQPVIPRLTLRAWKPLVLAFLLISGCDSTPGQQTSDDEMPPPTPSATQLQEELDDVLQYTYDHRHLDLETHAAWQILHGVLTYQEEFLVRTSKESDEFVSAVDHILAGEAMKGWTVRATDIPGGGRGLRAIMEPGTKAGQGHHDQWLAVLAQCSLPPETEIKMGPGENAEILTMADYVAQVQWDVASNYDREFSWTLIGLTGYLDTDAQWTASDGETWSIAELVRIEAEQARDDYAGACGGTHRLIGLAMALNRHVEQGGEIEGPWQLTDDVLDQAISSIQEYQNPDGSLSTNWLMRSGRGYSVDSVLSTTGHQLEFLVLALPEEDLHEEWVKRAASSLCSLFQETRHASLECGALYHAAHGLALYRERVYGEQSWQEAEE